MIRKFITWLIFGTRGDDTPAESGWETDVREAYRNDEDTDR